MIDLFTALGEQLGLPAERVSEALRMARALTGLAAPDPEATGLPCPHCGAKLKQLNCDSSTGVLFTRINMLIDTKRNVRGLISLIKGLAESLPEGKRAKK